MLVIFLLSVWFKLMAHITRAIELGTKYSGTTHYRVDDGWHTQSILKRNYH